MKLPPMRGTLKSFTTPQKSGNYEIAYALLTKKTTNDDDEVVEKTYAIKVFCNENNKRFISQLIGKKVDITCNFSCNSYTDKNGQEQWSQTLSLAFIKEYIKEEDKPEGNEGQDQEEIDDELRKKAKQQHEEMQKSIENGDTDDLPF